MSEDEASVAASKEMVYRRKNRESREAKIAKMQKAAKTAKVQEKRKNLKDIHNQDQLPPKAVKATKRTDIEAFRKRPASKEVRIQLKIVYTFLT